MADLPTQYSSFQTLKILGKKFPQITKVIEIEKSPVVTNVLFLALKIQYNVIIMKELEADDAMGIYATQHPGNVIVSPDKDMRQIPGKLYDLETSKDITAEEGAKWHLIQTLAGDQTDGYSGVPGIGVKRAETLFNKEGYNWSTVVKAFTDKGLTEDDALLNARLARILTIDDYDTTKQTPKLWTPQKPMLLTMEQQFKMRVIEDNLPNIMTRRRTLLQSSLLYKDKISH